jgi:hypothetical protein
MGPDSTLGARLCIATATADLECEEFIERFLIEFDFAPAIDNREIKQPAFQRIKAKFANSAS